LLERKSVISKHCTERSINERSAALFFPQKREGTEERGEKGEKGKEKKEKEKGEEERPFQ